MKQKADEEAVGDPDDDAGEEAPKNNLESSIVCHGGFIRRLQRITR
jgi:hypothetical protein